MKDSQASLAKVFSRMWRGNNEDTSVASFNDQDRTDRNNGHGGH